jgi:RNA polymerase sigma factor (sigma-70 family)
MTTGLTTLIEHLRTTAGRGALVAVGDPELLRRFTIERDEIAFAELVHRHAPAVYAMCRRYLNRPADLDDAFQATFVVLSQKAGVLAKPDRLSAWLCGVADRVARKARRKSAKRAGSERPLESIAEPSISSDGPESDLRAVLDDELKKLPPLYREAITLCDVDEVSRREAAKRLGIPDGTLSNRLSRARAMLGQRLLRRGVALGAGSCLSSVATASAPARLVALTVSRITSTTIPADVLALTGEVMTPMIPFRMLSLAVLSLCAMGVSYLTLSAREPVKGPPAKKAAEVEPPNPEPIELTGFTWVPAAVYSQDGKTLAFTRSDTRTVTLLDAATWKKTHTLEGMKELSHAVVFSADGCTLYAASYDGVIYTWDTKTGKAGATLSAKAGPCTGLLLSPDGKRLASGHHDPETHKTAIQIWDAKTGKAVRTISSDDPLLPNSIAFSPDGKTIAGGYHATHKDSKNVAGFHGVIEWDVATGKEVGRVETPRITSGASPVTHTIAYTKNGKQMIVGGGEAVPAGQGCFCVGYLWVFDRKTKAVEKTLVVNDRSDYVRLIALSADGDKLYVPTHTPPRLVVRNGQRDMVTFSAIQCWDTTTWELDWSHESESSTVSAVAASPNGRRVGVSNGRGFFLLDAKTGEAKGELVRVKRE